MGPYLRKIRFYHIFWVFFYFFLFCLLWHGALSYLDPDLGWHLQVGKEIARTGAVPSLNHYNYTFTGSWVDHEWLSNFLLYFSYSHFGYLATAAGFALLIIAVLILLNIWVRRVWPAASPGIIAFFQIIGVIASLPHFGVRIQEVGLLFLLGLLIIIADYNKKRRWRVLLFLPPLMYLWACLHASFLIGFFLLGAWVAVKLVEKILVRFWPKPWWDFSTVLNFREIAIFTGVAVLSLTVTLFTPYKLSLYSFLSGYQDSFYKLHIQEWLSQFSFPFHYSQLIYLAFAVLGVGLYIYHALGREKYFKIDLWTLFLAVLFIGLSFESRRHFPLMFVATFILLVAVYSVIFRLPAIDGGKWRLMSWLKIYLLVCLLLAAVYQLTQTKFITDPFQSFCADYPCGAVKFLESRPSYNQLNIFNDYGWGGYLIWTLPERQLFIDGRLPQVEFAGHTFLAEYLEFFKPGGQIIKKINQYDVKLILIPAKDQEVKAARWEKFIFGIKDEELKVHNYLRDYLLSAPDWQPVYYDQTAIIYVKKD